jgi:hypothetical protein
MVPVTCEVTWRKLTDEEMRSLAEQQAQAAKQSSAAGEPIYVGSTPATQPILVLTEQGGARELQIYCGPYEALAILQAQQGVEFERPMTHDLLLNVVETLGGIRAIRITELRDGTYLAEFVVTERSGEERVVSCRPSDGIAIATRAKLPILVAEPLFELGNLKPDGS